MADEHARVSPAGANSIEQADNSPRARQTQHTLTGTRPDGFKVRVRFWQYLPGDYNSSQATYPLLIFLHGAGETSQSDAPSADDLEFPRVLKNGPPKLIDANNELCFSVAKIRSCFIVLSPQAPRVDGGWDNARIRSLLGYAKRDLRVDLKRVYLTGLSMGGGGVWNFAAAPSGTAGGLNAAELAAIVPVAGAAGVSDVACNMAKARLPVWAFHGSADSIIPAQFSREFVDVLNGKAVGTVRCAANPVRALLTEYPGVEHDSWTQTYDPSQRFDSVRAQPSKAGLNIYEWMLGHRR